MSRRVKTLYDREQEELQREAFQERRNNKYTDIRRGDIFYFDKGPVTGVEQQGGRPGVIVSNDACNSSSDFVLVCYLTTKPKTCLPTHVDVMCEEKSICLCEQVHTLSKEKMQRYICTASAEEMKEIDKALVTALDIDFTNILPEDYMNIVLNAKDKLKEKDELIKNQDEYIKELQQQLADCKKLAQYEEEAKAERSKATDNSEYIKVCAERDVYMKLYNDLLEKVIKQVKMAII